MTSAAWTHGTILLDHGEGGAATRRLVRDLFLRHLGEPPVLEDAAVVAGGERIAVTTDTFVVRPLFFPGGNIGTLAVSGTVNDLAVMGAEPRYLSAGFVLEEGLELNVLDQVIASMARTAGAAGVAVITGDTKVVGRGDADGLYINTSGIGVLPDGRTLSAAFCEVGDEIVVSGPIGDHGAAVIHAREGFGLDGTIESDCRPVNDLTCALLDAVPGTRCMRDPTRGGLATALIEIADASRVRIVLDEEAIPVRRAVRAASDLLGLDPLYLPCEGRLIAVIPAGSGETALEALARDEAGKGARRIGEVVDGAPGVVLTTRTGGRRPLVFNEGAQLPRIC